MSKDGASRQSEQYDLFNARTESVSTKKDDVSAEQQLDYIKNLTPDSQLQ